MKYIKQHDLITARQLGDALGVDGANITRMLQKFCKEYLFDYNSLRLGHELVLGPKLLAEFMPWYSDRTTSKLKKYKSIKDLIDTAQRESYYGRKLPERE